jgi:hypothetical protein
MQTPKERPPPKDIHEKSRQLRTHSDQLILYLKRLLHESTQFREQARIRLDTMLEQFSLPRMDC